MLFKKKNKTGTEIENPIVFSSIAGQSEEINDQKDKIKGNLSFAWVILSFVFFVVLFRLFFLQVIKGDYYKKIAEQNRIRTLEVKAPRGLITDRNGEILASNIPSFNVVFSLSELPEKLEERRKVYSTISKELDLDEIELEKETEPLARKKVGNFLVEEGVDYEKALVLIEKFRGLAGVYLEKTAIRDYPSGKYFSSILGYSGKITEDELEKLRGYSLTDYIGKNGLEYTYEKALKGTHGKIRMEVDSSGEIKEELGIIPPISGKKLILNIDSNLQKKAYDVLEKALEVNKEARGAALVALDPRDGSVRALVSLPSYDNNLFVKGIDNEKYQELLNNPQHPLINRAIAGEYSPGSIFKPLLASIGLEEGVINSDTTLNCTGSISVGAWSFRDWKTHGSTNLNKAIAESCNVYFYAVGGGWENISGLGVDRISKYSKYFGLGESLGIDIPWEASGVIADSEWKLKEFGENWYIGDTYHMSIGQGFTVVTPLQIASAISVIANGGTLYQPQIVDKIVEQNGQVFENQNEIIRKGFIKPNNLEKVRSAMRETVTVGSGAALNNMKIEVAGKTGTAQFGNQGKTHSWFTSFAPFDDPEIVTVVLFDSGGEGHDWATPATEEFLREYFSEEPEPVDWEAVKRRVKARR